MPSQPPSASRPASGRRAIASLTIGLVLTITLVASEALAVATIMPIVAAELAAGDRALYGWVFSGFFLGSLLGIVGRRRAHRPRRPRPGRS